MRRLFKLVLASASTLLCFSAAYSTNVPNTDNPVTFVGPTARLGYTAAINNYTAYNVMGEAGLKNFRLGTTVGWKLDENQRFKLSAEYLWQKITYAFFSGNSNQWVNQGALGGAYQYEFLDTRFQPLLGIKAYFSHAPSKNLNPVSGIFTDSTGTLQTFTDNRRIAGSNGAGASPTIAFSFWRGSRIGAELDYDNVRYDTRTGPNENAKGLGGTVSFNQAFTEDVSLGLSAAVRKPFNNYAANLNWSYMPSPLYGTWILGLFGEYNVGKNTLPDTYNAGISANYSFDQRCERLPVGLNLKGERDLKGEVSPMLRHVSDDLLAWTADPAVYMPQVLAIVDKSNCSSESPPTLLSPLPSFINGNTIVDKNVHTFNSPSHFAGSNLTYSLSGVIVLAFGANPPDPSQIFSINPQTGVVTLEANTNVNDAIYELTITASNGCGSTTSASFQVEIDNFTGG